MSRSRRLTDSIAQKCMCTKTHGNCALWHACQAGRRAPFHHRRAAALPRAGSRTAFDSQTRHYGSAESRRTATVGAVQVCAFSLWENFTDHETQNSNSSLSCQVDCVLSRVKVSSQPTSTVVIISLSLSVSVQSRYSNGLLLFMRIHQWAEQLASINHLQSVQIITPISSPQSSQLFSSWPPLCLITPIKVYKKPVLLSSLSLLFLSLSSPLSFSHCCLNASIAFKLFQVPIVWAYWLSG